MVVLVGIRLSGSSWRCAFKGFSDCFSCDRHRFLVVIDVADEGNFSATMAAASSLSVNLHPLWDVANRDDLFNFASGTSVYEGSQ